MIGTDTVPRNRGEGEGGGDLQSYYPVETITYWSGNLQNLLFNLILPHLLTSNGRENKYVNFSIKSSLVDIPSLPDVDIKGKIAWNFVKYFSRPRKSRSNAYGLCIVHFIAYEISPYYVHARLHCNKTWPLHSQQLRSWKVEYYYTVLRWKIPARVARDLQKLSAQVW